MKRDGRGFDHRTLEAIRLMAVERVRGGERPSSVIASYRFHRTTIYKWIGAASKPGVGLKALRSRPTTGSATQFDAAPGASGVSLDQRPRPASVWPRLRLVDTARGGRSDRAEVQHSAWRVCGGRIARQVVLTPQKPLQRAYQRDPGRLRHGGVNGFLPLPDRQKPRAGKSISGISWAFVPTLCTARPGARRARHLWSNVPASGNRSARPPR